MKVELVNGFWQCDGYTVAHVDQSADELDQLAFENRAFPEEAEMFSAVAAFIRQENS